MITSSRSPLRLGLSAAVSAALAGAALVSVSPAQSADGFQPDPDVAAVLEVRPGAAGTSALIAPRAGEDVPRPDGLRSGASASTTARAYLATVAPELGVTGDAATLRDRGTTEVFDGSTVSRFQQYAGGLPVLGGQVVVALDSDGRLDSAGGETSPDLDDPQVLIDGAAAGTAAVDAAAAELDVPAASLALLADPFRYVYDPVVAGTGDGDSFVVWRVGVGPGGRVGPGGATVLVDARDGAIVSVVAHERQALNRGVCDEGNTRINPMYIGTECGGPLSDGYERSGNQAASGDSEVDDTFDNLGDVHDFFDDVLDVDLVSGVGFPRSDGVAWDLDGDDVERLRASVRFCLPAVEDPDCPMFNAFWLDMEYYQPGVSPYPGGAMFVGQGFAGALDVISHELAHGVTAATSGLEYQDQSGAINESMSDVFGELNEQWVEGPNSTWEVGEDIANTSALRSMSDPSTFDCVIFGDLYDCKQPDTLDSPLWYSGTGDHGGVHTNSGVGNKAAYLMTRGGTFKGRTVAPLSSDAEVSIVKAAKLYWKAQLLLTPNSDYLDLSAALAQACNSLVGTAVLTESFTTADCTNSVNAATQATGIAPDLTAPGPVTGLTVGAITTSSIALSWTNPTDSDLSEVIVRQATGSTPPASATSGTAVTLSGPKATSVNVTGLFANTEYSYAVFTRDVASNLRTPAVTAGATTAISSDQTAPGPVTGLTVGAVTTSSVALSWTNPADSDLRDVIVRQATGPTPPATATSGTAVTLPGLTATGVNVTGLADETTYSFAVFTRDTTGNLRTPAVTTSATTAGAVLTVVASVSAGQARHGTNVAVDTQVMSSLRGPVAGSTVVLQRRTVDSAVWVDVAAALTNGVGYAGFVTTADRSAFYRVFEHAGGVVRAVSGESGLVVTANVSSKLKKKRIKFGKKFTVTGKVAPASAGQAVKLQTLRKGKWKTTATAKLSGSSSYRFKHKPKFASVTHWRVIRPAVPNLAEGVSARFKVDAR